MNTTIQRFSHGIILSSLIWASVGEAQSDPNAARPERFNPKDLDNLEMFLESVSGLAIASNPSQEAYKATAENTPLEMLWSDQERFPDGTVRWWWDQSPYQNDKKLRPNRVFKRAAILDRMIMTGLATFRTDATANLVCGAD